MNLQTILRAILLLLITASLAWAVEVVKTGDSVVDDRALTIKGGFGQTINGLSFQQDALVTHGDHQYLGYYDGERRICLARRKLPTGPWESLRFDDYNFTSNDAHNTISIGVCPQDGTIHMAFDHHGHPLHYRASRAGVATRPEDVAWDARLFGPITSELEADKPIRITYPRFWQTPDGGLQFCYRRGGSGNGDRMMVDYDAKAGKWNNTRQIDSHAGVFQDMMGESRSRCSYPNGYTYGPAGKLHATWVWRESSQGANHDLVYAYSDDRGLTWRNNAGKAFAEPPGVNAPGATVVEIGRKFGLMNTHGQAVDSQGRVHVVMWHCSKETLAAAGSSPGEQRWGPPEARRYHHYWRDTSGVWRHVELPWTAGSRPKVFLDANDNAILIHGLKSGSVELEQGVFFNAGDLVIAAATAASGWTDWRVIRVEKGPFMKGTLGDPYRWSQDGVLSILAQETPREDHQPTRLRVLDFVLEKE